MYYELSTVQSIFCVLENVLLASSSSYPFPLSFLWSRSSCPLVSSFFCFALPSFHVLMPSSLFLLLHRLHLSSPSLCPYPSFPSWTPPLGFPRRPSTHRVPKLSTKDRRKRIPVTRYDDALCPRHSATASPPANTPHSPLSFHASSQPGGKKQPRGKRPQLDK